MGGNLVLGDEFLLLSIVEKKMTSSIFRCTDSHESVTVRDGDKANIINSLRVAIESSNNLK